MITLELLINLCVCIAVRRECEREGILISFSSISVFLSILACMESFDASQRLFRILNRIRCGDDYMPMAFVLINIETGSAS